MATETRGLNMERGISKRFPVMVKSSLAKMTPEQQSIFIDEYKRKRKNAFLLFLLAIFFPIQHFLLGKAGIGVIFWLTCGGLGVWWIIEIFLAIPRTRAYNNDAAIAVMRDLKIMAA